MTDAVEKSSERKRRSVSQMWYEMRGSAANTPFRSVPMMSTGITCRRIERTHQRGTRQERPCRRRVARRAKRARGRTEIATRAGATVNEMKKPMYLEVTCRVRSLPCLEL